MADQVTLKSLIGSHKLSGVGSGSEEGCNTFLFILDGKTYKAKEDPNDGYRSSLGTFEIVDEKVTNTFPEQDVVGRMAEGNNETFELIDAKNGKTILRIGTDNCDDYYPCFVSEFTPENMSINSTAV